MTSEAPQPPVLIIDDDTPVRHALARLLCRAGIAVLFADGGSAGIKILEHQPVSVILCDQHMPLMKGTDFLKRALQIQPKAVRIAITGKPDPQTFKHAINDARIDFFLSKPWDDRELVSVIREALTRFEQAA